MKQMTVNDLLRSCKEMVAQGYGDRKIVVADDEEGNGFHGLFYSFTVENLEDYQDMIYESLSTDPNEIVILG